MKRYLAQLFPKAFVEDSVYFRALALGGVYLFLLILQLFTFDKFFPIIRAYDVPGGMYSAVILTGLIPIIEGAALPYLISMKLSDRAWRLSRAAAIAVPLLWLLIAASLYATGDTSVVFGIFGATLPIDLGLWSWVLVVMLLVSIVMVAKALPRRKS